MNNLLLYVLAIALVMMVLRGSLEWAVMSLVRKYPHRRFRIAAVLVILAYFFMTVAGIGMLVEWARL